MTIQWFPGHMAKARREITEKLKLIDIVFELVDARIPISSRNPMIDEIVLDKPRLLLLNKSDMADPNMTKQWQSYFADQSISTLQINSQTGQGVLAIKTEAKQLVKDKFANMISKGIKPRAIRALIVGIPNVGKSTLINRLANRKIAKTGDRPGITKQQQWIKVGKELELLDTPGILWPKFEDERTGYCLAATGAIKDDLLDFQDVALFLLKHLHIHYPERVQERYRLLELPDDTLALFDAIAMKRGFLMTGGHVDYDRTAEMLLREFRSLKLGSITLENPGDF
ncbi:ribosome biogenesis GTPase YlqF [Pueribacillus sp. YX66]|uniref:ribosome biogenesis GTPase YlqF n=1 Tax=Pueribacillus sp. YX66 TaxID=3229242 RepID=UPI00358D58F5